MTSKELESLLNINGAISIYRRSTIKVDLLSCFVNPATVLEIQKKGKHGANKSQVKIKLEHNGHEIWAGFNSVVPIEWAKAYDRYLSFRGEGRSEDESAKMAKYGAYFEN